MPDIYGNLNVFGNLTIGEELSGGYTLPVTINNIGDVIGILPDNSVGFINLNESPYNYAKLSDIVEASGAPTYFQQLNDTPSDFTGSEDFVVSVNSDANALEFRIPNKIFDRIVQSSHGFSVGQALYTINGEFDLALASNTNPERAEVLGVVSNVIDADTFDIVYEGRVSGLTGLNPGSVYFLSPLIPGHLTTNKPSGLSIAKPVMVAIDSSEAVVVNYVGYISLANATDAARYFVSSRTEINDDYSLLEDDFYIRADTSSNNITITLPPATTNGNRIYKIKKVSSTNSVFVVVSGSDLILDNGLVSQVTLSNYESVELVSNGDSTWDVV